MRQINSLDLQAIMLSLGCLPLMFLPYLPSDTQWYLIAVILVIILLVLPSKFQKCWICVVMFGLSFLWSTAYSKQYLLNIESLIDETLVVNAKVESINTRQFVTLVEPYYVKFSILNNTYHPLSTNMPISIYWDMSEIPKSGQIWQLKLKTKVVHSYLNEGSFDSQRFAIVNRNLLTAKIIQANLLDGKIDIRQSIVDNVLPYINLFTYRGILIALAFGDRSQLNDDHRNIMMKTGVAHLMAISGMHILIVFGISYFLVKVKMFLIPQRFMHFYIPIMIGWLCAVFYAWLTGLNPPALRAILALTIWIYLRYKYEQISKWQKINRIIALLLLFDPLMILSESFWLSCYAVISLIFIYEWIPLSKCIQHKKRWYIIRLLHLQFSLTILLLPIQFFLFQGVSAVSLFTNLIAIPVISLITFPVILFALITCFVNCSNLTFWLWLIAEKSLEWLFYCLNSLKFLWINTPSNFCLLSFVGIFAIIIIRIGFLYRFNITVLIILMILTSPLLKKQDYLWRIDMLDVGHGLAIVIHNGKSAVLYDTGANWQKSSAAERIIIPFLQQHDLNVIGIIISHQHNDHIGGLKELQRIYPNSWLMSSSTQLNNNYQCLAGNSIIWNEITFKVLWPNKMVDYAENEDSCIVQVTDGKFSILLTGDLEHNQEYQLVSLYHNQLESTILQIPHHGSNTSSSYAFLNHVKPKSSLASTSRYNPWKLPSKKIAKRYKDLQLDYYTTARTGQIILFFYKNKWELKTMRAHNRPRWYHNWFGYLSDNY
ncbi:putative hydrolase of the metallo-beta-lactamase superfamily [Gilliamella apicola]|nr:DNA internalization-related competence protein ComEC/Rec2 [Gilliamella apicola]KFA59291.1 putative hydrolase of the metallo-beta-lactamase superfamily [Gilliamella apicola]